MFGIRRSYRALVRFTDSIENGYNRFVADAHDRRRLRASARGERYRRSIIGRSISRVSGFVSGSRVGRWTRGGYHSAKNFYASSPVRAVRAVLHVARRYVWPFRTRPLLKAFAVLPVVFALQQLIQMATTPLFPRAEDFLKQKGIDPAIAHELSDHPIRVRQRNLWGTLHSLNDMPTLFGIRAAGRNLLEPAQAYAFKGNLGASITGQYPVTLSNPDLTVKHAIGALGDLEESDEEAIENTPMTPEEAQMAIAFHEFSHCDTRNTKLDHDYQIGDDVTDYFNARANHAESDADARGYAAAAKVFHNNEIPKAFMYARALSQHSGAHDTCLYLDATIKGETPPDEVDTLQATKDIFAQLDNYRRVLFDQETAKVDHDYEFGPIENALVMQEFLKKHSDLCSDLAVRRGQLFVDAVKYFYPVQFAAAAAPLPPALILKVPAFISPAPLLRPGP